MAPLSLSISASLSPFLAVSPRSFSALSVTRRTTRAGSVSKEK